MIKVESLTYSYVKNINVFEDVNLDINEGDFLGILGKNGAGKSTFLSLLLGLKHPSNGSIKILTGEASSKAQPEIALISEDIDIKDDISVRDFLNFHSAFFKSYCLKKEKELLSYFGLNEKSIIASYSTGKRKLILAVACIASSSKILVVDEITAFLDPEARVKFFAKLTELNKKQNLTIILATNIAEDLLNRASRILYIEGKETKLLSSTQLKESFKL